MSFPRRFRHEVRFGLAIGFCLVHLSSSFDFDFGFAFAANTIMVIDATIPTTAKRNDTSNGPRSGKTCDAMNISLPGQAFDETSEPSRP